MSRESWHVPAEREPGVLYMHGHPGTDYAAVRAIEVDGPRFERADIGTNDGTRWKEIFGTPERAVETLAAIMLMSRYPCGENGVTECSDCPLEGAPCRLNRANPSESELVEWLKGEVSADD